MTQCVAPIGSWQWHAADDCLLLSDAARRILAPGDENFPQSFQQYLHCVHADDRPLLLQAQREAIEGAAPLDIAHRFVRVDGGIRHIRLCAERIVQKDKSIILAGTAQDITGLSSDSAIAGNGKWWNIIELLHDSEERYALAARASHAAFWDWKLPGEQIIYSAQYREMLGYSKDEFPDTFAAFEACLHPEDKENTMRVLQQHIVSRVPMPSAAQFRMRTKAGEYRWFEARAQAVWDATGSPTRVVGATADIHERRQAETALRESEARFRELAGNIQDVFFNFDFATKRLLYINPAYESIWQRSRESLYADPSSYLEAIHPDDRELAESVYRRQIKCEQTDIEYRIVRADGEIRWIRESTYPVANDKGRVERVVGIARDITDSRQATWELMRTNRALQLLSRCNETVIRATSEQELLDDTCRLALEVGGYRMAWVGYALDDEAKSISIVSHAGAAEDTKYLSALRLSWCEDNAGGKGPAGRTVRSGMPSVVEDLTRVPHFSPWHDAAKRYGYSGLLSLPLRDGKRTFGVMFFYSVGVLTASDEEIRLLQKLADNLAFGITTLRARKEQKQIQAGVLKVASSISASTGTEFFEQLARNMGEAVGAHAAFVARLLPGEAPVARIIAAFADGRAETKADFPVAGTPCEKVLEAVDWVVPRKVAELFPGCPKLASFGAQGYVGRRLADSAGRPIGLLFVLFREPLRESELITSTLQIFAARASAELERQDADARIRDQASLLDKAQDAIVVRAIDDRILFWNKSAERLYGWRAEEVLDRAVQEQVYDSPVTFEAARRKVLATGEWSGEATHRRKDGSTFMVESRWTLLRDDAGNPKSILVINTDITRRKLAENEIRKLAFYDPLTGLPNRPLLLDRLHVALAASGRSGKLGALLFVDLDNFKTLNDTLGHDKGDLLLRQVAARLSSCVRASDTVARLGGDEFVVMLENVGSTLEDAGDQAKTIGYKILDSFHRPYRLADHAYHSTPSIGIALFDGESKSVDELLKRADLAMYQAKAAGRNTLCSFDPSMQTVATQRAHLEADVRQALRRGEFLLHYQPQVDGDGEFTGAEALLRWQHPRRGLVSPSDFISLTEDTGLILPLGQWVLEAACAQLSAWAAHPRTASLCLAVNVSARQLRHPEFADQVLAALRGAGADPRRLKLEITESLLVENVEDTIAKMSRLKSVGVGFALDDFGTGYSSLSYLKRLPLDQLKIDRSFVRDVLTDPNDAVIARTIVALGQSLGLAVIAEGVETREQRDFLARHGCNAYQGFLFSEPLDIKRFEAVVHAQTSAERLPARRA